jgi:hypothetical protein
MTRRSGGVSSLLNSNNHSELETGDGLNGTRQVALVPESFMLVKSRAFMDE